jgi:hypothetical protein
MAKSSSSLGSSSLGIKCDPAGAKPSHNRMLERHNVPPEAIEDCEQSRIEGATAYPDMRNQASDKGSGMREAIENAHKRRTLHQKDLAREAGRERRLDERQSPLIRKSGEQTSALDQSKRGLQDDHDPNDIGQKQANRKGGI